MGCQSRPSGWTAGNGTGRPGNGHSPVSAHHPCGPMAVDRPRSSRPDRRGAAGAASLVVSPGTPVANVRGCHGLAHRIEVPDGYV